MKKTNRKIIIFFFFILLSIINSVSAQEPHGTITGTLTDDKGFVSNAKLTLKPKQKSGVFSNWSRTTTSRFDGTFKFIALPLGTYYVKIENNCVKARKNDIEIKPAETVNIEIKIGSEDCVQKEALETAKWKLCQENTSQNNIDLNKSDKSEIFRELLKNADEEYKIPDYDILANQPAGIVMSAEDADKNWLKQITNPRMTILNPTEIKAFAKKRKEDIMVLFFDARPIGNCVKVSIGTGVIIGKKSKKIYLSGGGCGYTFQKEAGKWVGKQDTCIIS
jgi:hypothetical protein